MHKTQKYCLTVGTSLLCGFVGYSSCSFYVEQGKRAIIFSKFSGVQKEIYGEGLHFFIPGMQVPIITNIELRETQLNCQCFTRDQKPLNFQIKLVHKPMEDQLLEIFISIGYNYDVIVLPSLTNEVGKQVFSQYKSTELNIPEIQEKLKQLLKERASHFSIIIDNVELTIGSQDNQELEKNMANFQSSFLHSSAAQVANYQEQRLEPILIEHKRKPIK